MVMISDLLFKCSPNWLICREIKLLYTNNRIVEAFDMRTMDDMGLTRYEKLVLKRAFKEIRQKHRREKMKEWALKYALTGQEDSTPYVPYLTPTRIKREDK